MYRVRLPLPHSRGGGGHAGGGDHVGLRDRMRREKPGTVRQGGGGDQGGRRDGMRGEKRGTVRQAKWVDLAPLEAFGGSRRGVEGFVDPATMNTTTTLVLVAGDGEWTRRRVDSPKAAFSFGQRL